jgi:hypothetical protein
MMGKFSNSFDPMVGAQLAPAPEVNGDSGFAAVGKPVPFYRQQVAYDHCKQMGMTDRERIWDCVRGMSNKIERDQPADAMEHGIRFVNAIGVYRLMAVLLAAERPSEPDRYTEWDFCEDAR